MRSRTIAAVLLLSLSFTLSALRVEAQERSPEPSATLALEAHPGYVPMEELALLPKESLSIEVDLSGPLLRLIAGATKSEDPEFAGLLSGLLSIRVQVGSVPSGKGPQVEDRASAAARWLDDHGWHPTVRMRDKDGQNYIYLKEHAGDLVGLMVVAHQDNDEAVLVNIVGRIDQESLGQLAGRFDIPALLGSDSAKP